MAELTEDKLARLREKARWVWEQTLLIHKLAPDTRVASSLSIVETLVALYYGDILRFQADDPTWDGRDRMIASKGHGTISLYPILADLGFFDMKELGRVSREGSFLGAIPDPIIPGYETVNGSLGHGLGVGCGIARALAGRPGNCRVFVVVGDGELYEGANWEAVMFAGHHHLENLVVIVDNNGRAMLGDTEDIISLFPLADKFRTFGWEASEIDGHDLASLHTVLAQARNSDSAAPRVVVANTVKGKGVPQLETDPLCHVRSLSPDEVDDLVEGCNNG